MPIETNCPGCSRRLRVGDEHAGRMARCPQCGAVYQVPRPAAELGGEVPPAADRWFLKIPDGREFGPVTRAELNGWVRERRVSADCQLRSERQTQWLPADRVYPGLAKQATNPFADRDDNPFTAPQAGSPYTTRRFSGSPHRGGAVLTFGILAWAICCVFGPVAWAMGAADLKAMNNGQMDPEGRGLTMAGMVLGMISTILSGGIFILILLAAMA